LRDSSNLACNADRSTPTRRPSRLTTRPATRTVSTAWPTCPTWPR
jgi:hypothetical protein